MSILDLLREHSLLFKMEAASGAASVIAIVSITGQTLVLCQRYDTAVKDARQDIQRLRNELDAFIEILTKLVDIVDVLETSISPAPKRLTHKNNLMKSLEMSQGTNDMSKSNLRSLK